MTFVQYKYFYQDMNLEIKNQQSHKVFAILYFIYVKRSLHLGCETSNVKNP